MSLLPFPDRTAAGVELGRAVAASLAQARPPDCSGEPPADPEALEGRRVPVPVVVLGIPRGGVVVAAEVARCIAAPLDVLVAHKIGAPGNPEFAIGAVTADGTILVAAWARRETGMSAAALEDLAAREVDSAVAREGRLRAGRPPMSLAGAIAILVDDGLATGATVHAAVLAVRARGAARVVVAAPVASREAVALLEPVADEVIVVAVPGGFHAVGQWYVSFGQVDDETVLRILAADAAARGPSAPGGPEGHDGPDG
jgi:putative phosphoribosyl transferase